jgi:2-hydroxycyclohexanecarboxyl-CoA dehydrogenase
MGRKLNARLERKVALVTGAARGIGRAIAARLASEGAAVAICDIQAERAATTAGEIRAAGASAMSVAMDVADLDQVAAAAEKVEAQLGPIGILVNNAGWERIMPFLDSTPELWDRIIAINYRGTLNCCKVVAPFMKERGSGKIVSIASDAGRVGSTGEAVYSGCKAAIIGFSKTLARELAKYRVNVNVVCPGPTDTEMLHDVMGDRPNLLESLKRGIPFGRLGEPGDLAGAVAFFASPDADFITGQVLSVSGGLTMAG